MKKFVQLIFLFPLLTAQLFAQVTITNGTQMKVVGNTKVVVKDLDLKQDGTLDPAQSSFIFTGTQSSTISGNAVNFYQLVVDKSGSELSLSDSINVSGKVVFVQGNFDLSGKVLNLGNSGSLFNESESNRFLSSVPNGKIMREEEYMGGITAADSGNLGIEITSGAVLGLTQIIRSHDPQLFPGGDGIRRYYEVVPANNSNLNATVRFKYFDSELNGLAEGSLLLFDSFDDGNSWNLLGVSNINTGTNFLEQGGINRFGLLTAATQATFPVEWLDFQAEAINGKYSLLTWVTGSEQNNQGFLIERTLKDGPDEWEAIGFVEGEGNATTPTIYEFIDQSPSSGENFYRLKQVDINGTYDYSQIRSVYFEPLTRVLLYPNPATTSTKLEFEAGEDQEAKLLLFDAGGKLIRTSQHGLFAGRNRVEIDVEELPDGIYFIRMEGKGLSFTTKLKVD